MIAYESDVTKQSVAFYDKLKGKVLHFMIS